MEANEFRDPTPEERAAHAAAVEAKIQLAMQALSKKAHKRCRPELESLTFKRYPPMRRLTYIVYMDLYVELGQPKEGIPFGVKEFDAHYTKMMDRLLKKTREDFLAGKLSKNN